MSRRSDIILVFSAKVKFCTLLFGALLSISVAGQTVSLVGESYNARECLSAATRVAESQNVRFEDIQVCANAIELERLNTRDLVATLINRGIIYTALGQVDNASEDYEAARRIDNSVAAIYLNRGNLWLVSGEYGRAIEDYTRALELELDRPEVALLNRGLAYEYQSDRTQAQRDYRDSLVILPEWPEALRKLARVESRGFE